MFDAPTLPLRPLMQDPAFAAALSLLGRPPVILPGGSMILRRRLLGLPFAMLPRAMPPPDLTDQLEAAGLGRVPLILSPHSPCPSAPALRLLGPQQMALLDLSTTRDRRIAGLHPKWRNQWRRAMDTDLHLSHGPLPPDPTHPLLVAETRQRQQRRYAGWPIALTCAFAAAAPDQTRLFIARQKGRVVAQMLFLRHGTDATYHIGNTTSDGRAVHAHNLLLMVACDWLAARGHLNLDLGLLHRRTPQLNRFKLRCGAQARPTGGTWLRWRPF